METELNKRWNSWEAYANRYDADHMDETNTRVPPNLGPLVRAVRLTSLRRWAPSTSHEYFHLRAGLRFDAARSPALIARHRTYGYLVFPRYPQDEDDDVRPTLVTRAATEAAAELERLLANWRPAVAAETTPTLPRRSPTR